VLFKSALAILKIIRDDIQANTDIEKINSIFEETTRNLNECDTMIYYLVLRRFGFDDNFLMKNRISLNTTIIENILKNNETKIQRIEQEQKEGKNKRRASYVKNASIECFPDWPLCIYDLNYKYHIVEFLVFKVHEPPLMIENYFFDIIRHKTNSPSKALRRKSKSSENYKKAIELEREHRISVNSQTEAEFDDNEDFEEKLECYNNLLIERRPHCCFAPDDVSCTTSVVLDNDNSAFEQNEIEGSYIEIKNSFKDITSNIDLILEKRTMTMFKGSDFSLPKQNSDFINYSKLLSSLSKS
jgi:hypothetical protein